MSIPVWTAVKILRLSSLDLMRLFAARSVKRKTWKERCPNLPSRELIVSSEQAVLPVAGRVRPEIVPVAIDRWKKATGDE